MSTATFSLKFNEVSKGDNFIDRYVEVVERHVDAPEIFIRASAYWVISALLGRYFRCPQLPHLSARPNLWFVLSSIPGAMRRSTVQSLAEHVYRRAYIGYLVEHERMERRKAEAIVDDSLIEEGTPEGIIDHIEATQLDSYAIVSTEFGAVLKRALTREYELGVLSLFAKLYYGEGGSMCLSRRGERAGVRRLRRGLFVTMLAGMQEAREYVTPNVITQGLLRRLILCYIDPRSHDRWLPPIGPEREWMMSELEHLAHEIKERMISLAKVCGQSVGATPLINTFLTPSVKEKVVEYAKELDMAVRKDPNDINIYKQSLWEHLAKLAIVHAIAKGRLDNIGNELILNVREEDLVEACNVLNEAVKNVEAVVSSLGEREEPIKTSKALIERVYQAIVRAGPEGIRRTRLYRQFADVGLKSRELDEIIVTLMNAGRVKTRVEETGGRPAVVYIADVYVRESEG
jgi:hypothetical protein